MLNTKVRVYHELSQLAKLNVLKRIEFIIDKQPPLQEGHY